MARLSLTTRKHKKKTSQMVVTYLNKVMTSITWFFITVCKLIQIYANVKPRIKNISSDVDRQSIMYKYAYKSDTTCISHLRMTWRCFTKFCDMLYTLGGLRTSRHIGIDEQVTIFLHIIAHNVKNRVMIGRFQRSGETISKIVTRVCNVVIRLHPHLLKKPEPVTDNSTDQRWNGSGYIYYLYIPVVHKVDMTYLTISFLSFYSFAL